VDPTRICSFTTIGHGKMRDGSLAITFATIRSNVLFTPANPRSVMSVRGGQTVSSDPRRMWSLTQSGWLASRATVLAIQRGGEAYEAHYALKLHGMGKAPRLLPMESYRQTAGRRAKPTLGPTA